MGGKNESQIKKQITNEISMEITNITKNLNTIVNTSTYELTQEIQNNAEAEVSINTGGTNLIDVDEINIGSNSKININQDVKIAAVAKAIIKILSDTSQLQNNINNMADKIKNKIDSDANVKQDVDFLAKVGKNSTENGGPEGMINSLTDTVKSLMSSVTGGSSSSKDETEIRTIIKNKLHNEVINQTDTTNKISTSIKNKMEQLGKAICKIDTVGGNSIISRKLTSQAGSIANINQNIDISSFSTCIIDLELGSKIASDLTNDFKIDVGTDGKSKTTSGQAAKVVADAQDVSKKDSSVMKSVDNLVDTAGEVAKDVVKGVSSFANSFVYVIGGIILVIVLVIVGPALMGSSKSGENSPKNNQDDDDDDDDDNDDDGDKGGNYKNQKGGGINGNIYLSASFITMLILISDKSLTLCGVLLIVLILYFTNIKKSF
jgi:hypothetical protein